MDFYDSGASGTEEALHFHYKAQSLSGRATFEVGNNLIEDRFRQP
jgi:hypothetical protein